METGEKCEECGIAINLGDHVTYTLPKNYVFCAAKPHFRVWHTACFENSLTPIKDWPRDEKKRAT